MSVKTVGFGVLNFGAAKGADANCEQKDLCGNIGHALNYGVNSKKDNFSNDAFLNESFKGLAAAPVAAGAGTFGAGVAVGTMGVLGALGTALALGFKTCVGQAKASFLDMAKTACKNAPNTLDTLI